ncbi:MAG: hypothetical protein ACN6PX_20250, partial [Stenotrophomonas lactitubi]|uniref:hypothetical protein n=1 Tax=Stenotrophomonas lactitubi TaxID=2045214 RepID=UPI003D0F0539
MDHRFPCPSNENGEAEASPFPAYRPTAGTYDAKRAGKLPAQTASAQQVGDAGALFFQLGQGLVDVLLAEV